MKKADIRTTATLNIHEKRMNEIKEADPVNYGKTEASAKAYREIKDGLLDAEIKAEIKRLTARINGKKGARLMTDDQKAEARKIEVENYVERIEEIKALKQIIARKEYENDRLMERNNAGAAEVAELREDLKKARNLATTLADRLEDVSENFDEIKRKLGDRDIEIEGWRKQRDELIPALRDANRAIEDLKLYKKVAEDKVEQIRNTDFNPIKFGAAVAGRKAEIFDEILDAITRTEFDILRVKVDKRAIEIIEADFAERGIEIEW